jgi:uncharacterized lipoprotein YmbA
MTASWRPWQMAVLAMVVSFAACSSANPTLYTIAPVAGSAQTDPPQVILPQQIGLARYLERSQIVRSSENYRLDVMSNDWWGEPLGAMMSRVLTEELGQRLPQSVVLSETGGISSPGDATIALNLQRLDEDRRQPGATGPGSRELQRATCAGAPELPLCGDDTGAGSAGRDRRNQRRGRATR